MTRRSTIVYCVFLGSNPLSFPRKKQAFNKKASTGFIKLQKHFRHIHSSWNNWFPFRNRVRTDSHFPFPRSFSPWAGLRKNWNTFLHCLLSATWDVGTYLFMNRIFPGFQFFLNYLYILRPNHWCLLWESYQKAHNFFIKLIFDIFLVFHRIQSRHTLVRMHDRSTRYCGHSYPTMWACQYFLLA